MGNINHNRPQLRYTDNIRKVLLHEQQQMICEKRIVPDKAPKKWVCVALKMDETKFCLSFLNAIDDYYTANSTHISSIMGKGKKVGLKESSEKAEKKLRIKIRALYKGIVAAELEKRESGLMGFLEHFKEVVGEDSLIIDLMASEMILMSEELEA